MRFDNIFSTVYRCYRDNFWLYLRIMLPVALVAILLNVTMHYRDISDINKHLSVSIGKIESQNQEREMRDASPRVLGYSAVGQLNTRNGLIPTIPLPENFDLPTKLHWEFFPLPSIYEYNSYGDQWTWSLNFRVYDHTPLILFLFTLCPLTLAIAGTSLDLKIANTIVDTASITARDTWKRTGEKALIVFIAAVLFLLIVNIGQYIHVALVLLFPSIMELWSYTVITVLILIPHIYFLVTLSLYNPCLILENNSVFGIFRRSHSLVSGSWIRFLWIYLFTGWFAAVFASVVFGSMLLLLSFFFSELSPIRDALTPLRFLTLLIGGNVEVTLSWLPGILPTVLVCVISVLIAVFLVPIWAIITTHLYFERSRNTPDIINQMG